MLPASINSEWSRRLCRRLGARVNRTSADKRSIVQPAAAASNTTPSDLQVVGPCRGHRRGNCGPASTMHGSTAKARGAGTHDAAGITADGTACLRRKRRHRATDCPRSATTDTARPSAS